MYKATQDRSLPSLRRPNLQQAISTRNSHFFVAHPPTLRDKNGQTLGIERRRQPNSTHIFRLRTITFSLP
jgi:hypothetical protein